LLFDIYVRDDFNGELNMYTYGWMVYNVLDYLAGYQNDGDAIQKLCRSITTPDVSMLSVYMNSVRDT